VAKARPRKIAKYGERFKATVVKLSSLPGVLIQDVAAALDIHPFMLSLWRKQVREGVIVARASKLDVETTAELRRLIWLNAVKRRTKFSAFPAVNSLYITPDGQRGEARSGDGRSS